MQYQITLPSFDNSAIKILEDNLNLISYMNLANDRCCMYDYSKRV